MSSPLDDHISAEIKFQQELNAVAGELEVESNSKAAENKKTDDTKTTVTPSPESINVDSHDPYDPNSVDYDPNLISGNTPSELGKNEYLRKLKNHTRLQA